MKPIGIDSIEIPAHYVELCAQWYSGQTDLLYAVASTGNLTLGNRRPRDCDTDEKWYLDLWRGFSGDAWAAVKSAKISTEHDDLEALEAMEAFAYDIVEQLETSYGLADWESLSY